MIVHPDFDPVAVAFGPLRIHWYGLTYLAAFAAFWWLAVRRSRRTDTPVQADQIDDLLFFGALGVVLGGRIGYTFFYGWENLVANPMWLLRVWEGGMSFHGGMVGVFLGMWVFARKHGIGWWRLMDFVAPLVPIGLGFGRLGNFIGQELWGRPTDLPWGMVFPRDPLQLARHPSQLYQFALEGIVLFGLLYWYSRMPRPRMAVSGFFLMGYGSLRFLVEFVREPDAHLQELTFGLFTRGQMLSLPMIVIGTFIVFYAYQQDKQLVDKKR